MAVDVVLWVILAAVVAWISFGCVATAPRNQHLN